MIEIQELRKPKGRVPNEVLQYCAEMVGSTIETYLDTNDELIKTIKLGHHTISYTTNRKLIEKVFRLVSEMPQ